MCGEKPNRILWEHWKEGSPPHVRGKDLQRPRQHRRTGITPACAGKRRVHRGAGLWSQDHPRMCGEKPLCSAKRNPKKGSPPHVRGKAAGHWIRRVLPGITPACAGKRKTQHIVMQHSGDHPRMCGEKRFPAQGWRCKAGSPPHVRGKVSSSTSETRRPGITPACAGKRAVIVPHACHAKDHPRMCGEKAFIACVYLRMLGSPPHVRGKEDSRF